MDKKAWNWDYIGFYAIGLYAIGSALFGSHFSELHVSLNFLSFPIFIGEFLIAGCLILLYLKNRYKPIIWQPWQEVLWVYLLCIALKGLWDYAHWGALSFRNAALFYYPVFIFFGYEFFCGRTFSFASRVTGLVILLLLSSIFLNIDYFWYSASILFIVLFFTIKSNRWRLALGITFLLICKYRPLFSGSRTNFVGTVAAISFLVLIYLMFFLKMSWQRKVFLGGALCCVIGALFLLFGDRNALLSLYRAGDTYELYVESKAYIKSHEHQFAAKSLKANLYYDNKQEKLDKDFAFRNPPSGNKTNVVQEPLKPVSVQESKPVIFSKPKDPVVVIPSVEEKKPVESIPEQEKIPVLVKEKTSQVSHVSKQDPGVRLPLKEIKPVELLPEQRLVESMHLPEKQIEVKPVVDKKQEVDVVADVAGAGDEQHKVNVVPAHKRTILSAQANTVFRILIWEDMFKELIDEKAWFGFGLGKPQRSRSLEIMRWAQEEWSRDGWITPHNAYFHMIYRFGIIGLGLIVVIIIALLNLTRQFIKARSFIGIALVSILVFWLMTANSLVILELPHYAIFFWAMWGVTMAYADSLKLRSNAL